MKTPTKGCPQCAETKPIEEFHKNKSETSGINTICKVCARKNSSESRQKPGAFEKQQRYHKNWRAKQPKKDIPPVALIGRTFGEYVVLEKAPSDSYNNHRWLCRCSCGKQKVIHGSSLLAGKVQRCRECSNKFGHPRKRVKVVEVDGVKMKTCTGCGKLLPVTSFKMRKNARLPGGFQYLSRCLDCARIQSRKAMLKKCYGITLEDFESMKEQQQGLCAICRTDSPGGFGDWHVDHDHETGRVRGLLCALCNMSLGGYEILSKFDVQAYLKGNTYGLPL